MLDAQGEDLGLPIGFAGGIRDRHLGLVRFGHRDYDPAMGRFTAPDPLGDTGGDHDPWEYCVDDPVNAIDPMGLEDEPSLWEKIVRKVPVINFFYENKEQDAIGEEMRRQEEEASKLVTGAGGNSTRIDPARVYDDIADKKLEYFKHAGEVLESGGKAANSLNSKGNKMYQKKGKN